MHRSARRSSCPCSSCSRTASSTASGAWPRIIGPQLADEVDVLVAVDVPDAAALRAVVEDRVGADGLERADRRVDAARDDLLGDVRRTPRTWCAAWVFRPLSDDGNRRPAAAFGPMRSIPACARSGEQRPAQRASATTADAAMISSTPTHCAGVSRSPRTTLGTHGHAEVRHAEERVGERRAAPSTARAATPSQTPRRAAMPDPQRPARHHVDEQRARARAIGLGRSARRRSCRA